MAKVSIIIPVYNGEAYLEENLASLANQTCKDFEAIYVDDGSTDRSVEILQNFAKENAGFQLLRQEHSTAGAARNLGLRHAQGEYCLFLDADDFFDPDLISKSTAAADAANADITLFSYDRYHHGSGTFTPQPSGLQTRWISQLPVFSWRDIPDFIFNISTASAWTKLFRRSFINRHQLAFQSLHNSNDVYFVLLAIAKAERIAWVDRPLVHYRVDISGNLQSCKHRSPCDFITAFLALGDSLRQDGLYEQVEKSYLKAMVSCFAYNIRGAYRAAARDEIYQRMLQPDVQALHLPTCSDQECQYPDDRSAISGFLLAMSRQAEKNKPVLPAEVIGAAAAASHPIRVSVIVPVYRTEAYVRQCLDSLVNQTLQDIEILCINDGSDDQCESILLAYAAADPRITVLSQSNQGLSAARNRGMERARGEYLYFCDSDDYIELTAMEELYRAAKAQDAEMVIFNGQSFFESDELKERHAVYTQLYQRQKDYGSAQSGQALFEQLMASGEYTPSVCLYLVSRDHLLRYGFHFLEGAEYEDNLFTFQVMVSAEKAVHKHETYYHRRIRDHSIVTEDVTFQKAFSYFTIHNALAAYIRSTPLTETCALYACQFLGTLLATAQRQYTSCSPAEQYGYLALDPATRYLFDTLIVQPVRARGDYRKQEELLAATKKQLNGALANNRPPKRSILRRALRLFQKGFLSLRQNGFRATWNKTTAKIKKHIKHSAS